MHVLCSALMIQLNGNGIGHINEVALRWVGSVSTWVGDCRNSTPGHGNLSRSNQPPRSTQHGYPLVGEMSTGNGLLATTRQETASSA